MSKRKYSGQDPDLPLPPQHPHLHCPRPIASCVRSSSSPQTCEACLSLFLVLSLRLASPPVAESSLETPFPPETSQWPRRCASQDEKKRPPKQRIHKTSSILHTKLVGGLTTAVLLAANSLRAAKELEPISSRRTPLNFS